MGVCFNKNSEIDTSVNVSVIMVMITKNDLGPNRGKKSGIWTMKAGWVYSLAVSLCA